MIDKAIEIVAKMGKETAYPRTIHPEQEPKNVYLLVNADGTHERFTAISNRDHQVNSVPFLINALRNCVHKDDWGSVCSVWFNKDRIVGMFDDKTRNDSVTLEIGLSPQIEALKGLEISEPDMDQKELIRFLKHTMAGCLGPTGNLLKIIRSIKFTFAEDAAAARSQGKVSIGNTIKAELTGDGDLPEYVQFAVPVFANPMVQDNQPIMCSLEVDTATKKFSLCPCPLEIEQAIAKAEMTLLDRLNAAIGVGSNGEKSDEAIRFVLLAGSPTGG